MTRVDEVFQALDGLGRIELNALKGRIEQDWGVTAMTFIAPQPDEPVAPAKKTTGFTVTLAAVPMSAKLPTIKMIREITSLGLKESKQLVDTVPSQVVADVSQDRADEIRGKLEAAGSEVSVE